MFPRGLLFRRESGGGVEKIEYVFSFSPGRKLGQTARKLISFRLH
jgi:hypothetical protein